MKMWRYYGPQHLVMEEGPPPRPGLGEVVIHVAVCGICATDLKTYQRGHPLIPQGTVLGHEVVGTIAEVGPNVQGWQQGERIVVAPYIPCGACRPCRREQFTMCEHLFNSALDPGGFSEYARVPAPLVQQGMYHFPTTIDETMGTLVEPLACCLHAMHAMNLTQGDSLLIIGDGTMGLLQAELARTLGAHPIIVSGTMPHRLERASRAADIIINAWSEDMVGRVKQITGGYGVDKVLVSVPNAHLVEEAMAVAARGGTVSLFAGLSEQDHLAISAHRIHYDEVRLLGTFGFGPDDFRQAADMIISQSIHVDGIVTDIVDFGSVDYALRHATPEHGIKAAVRMR